MTTENDFPWLSSYAEGVPATVELPTGSLVDMFEETVRKHRNAVALEFFGRTTTYAELGTLVSRAADGLRRRGVKPGDRVALVLPNCPQHVVAFYAVLRIGGVVVEHNPLYTDREMRHQFEDHGARVAIVWDKIGDRIHAMPKDIAFDTVIAVNLPEAMPLSKRVALKLPIPAAKRARTALTAPSKKSVPWSRLIGGRAIAKSYPRPAVTDLAVLQYTSGTTGAPKGAKLTHLNLHVNAIQGRAWLPGLRDGKEVVYAILPMFHAYGLTLCLTFAMKSGARLVLLPRFDVDLVLDAAKKNPPTFLPAVPPIYERLATAALKQKVDLSGIRFAISGAMNLPAETVQLWESVTGGMLVEGYGLTETSPVALGNPVGPTRKVGTVGVPFPSTEIRIVDRDDPSVDVEPGEPGELLIRGPQVFQGYWQRPDETDQALIGDGWFRTGDIATSDADGFVTIVDRIKELIITGGFNVAPSEVEDAIKRHPAVADVAVVGLPRTGGGEDVVAAVVLVPGSNAEPEQIRAFCRENLTAYKVPKRIFVVEELPRSLIGKILRKAVRTSLLAE